MGAFPSHTSHRLRTAAVALGLAAGAVVGSTASADAAPVRYGPPQPVKVHRFTPLRGTASVATKAGQHTAMDAWLLTRAGKAWPRRLLSRDVRTGSGTLRVRRLAPTTRLPAGARCQVDLYRVDRAADLPKRTVARSPYSRRMLLASSAVFPCSKVFHPAKR
jgi:hypothetical protein